MKGMNFLFMILLTSFQIACTKGADMKVDQRELKILNILQGSINNLSNKKLYFGHQSVGYNIIDGIREIQNENPKIKLNIKETKNLSDFSGPVFAHSANGENMNPESKINDFAKSMKDGLGNKVDSAFFKFCYIDFDLNSNIDNIFNKYKSSLDDLIKRFPNTRFFHFTVPLTSDMKPGLKNSVKDLLKRILGRATSGDVNSEINIKRNKFNDLLKKEYGADVFDIAAIESTYPDGKRERRVKNNISYYSLIPDYTSDGGHLNNTGKRIVADRFLVFMAEKLK